MSNNYYLHITNLDYFLKMSIMSKINYKIIFMSHLNNVWKEFEEVEITHSILHYLFAIKELQNEKWYSRAVDIAKDLKITAGSCSIWLKNLIKKWLIIEDENKFYTLSKKWEKIVNETVEKRKILYNFFTNVLWIDKNLANINSCKLEHLIDNKISEKIKEKFL